MIYIMAINGTIMVVTLMILFESAITTSAVTRATTTVAVARGDGIPIAEQGYHVLRVGVEKSALASRGYSVYLSDGSDTAAILHLLQTLRKSLPAMTTSFPIPLSM